MMKGDPVLEVFLYPKEDSSQKYLIGGIYQEQSFQRAPVNIFPMGKMTKGSSSNCMEEKITKVFMIFS